MGDTADGRGRRWRTPPAERRRANAQNMRRPPDAGLAGGRGDPMQPRLPRPPAPAGPGGPNGGDTAIRLTGWDHLLVNGSDATFRRMLRGVAALVRRLDTIHDLAGRAVGVSGQQLECLLAVAELEGAHAATGDEAGSVSHVVLARTLGVSRAYVSKLTQDLAAAGLLAKRPDPGNTSNRVVGLTAAGRDAVAAAAPLIEGAHNLAFAPLKARDFATLTRLAAALDESSAHAVDLLSRRTDDDMPATSRELRRAMRRLGGGRAW